VRVNSRPERMKSGIGPDYYEQKRKVTGLRAAPTRAVLASGLVAEAKQFEEKTVCRGTSARYQIEASEKPRKSRSRAQNRARDDHFLFFRDLF
jgi:hypothetical protein